MEWLEKINNQGKQTSVVKEVAITRKLDKDGYCIAHITTTEDLQTGLVNVDYLSSHSCHKPSIEECRYLPPHPSLCQMMQEKCAAGISIEKIMDDEL